MCRLGEVMQGAGPEPPKRRLRVIGILTWQTRASSNCDEFGLEL
jgi:hypothetical protein